MHNNKLDILVLLRESSDPRPPASVTTRGAAISDRGLRRVPNPADIAALEEALYLKDNLAARVTVIAIGPERLDDTLRLAFSMGADRGIRFWDHGLEGGDALAAAAAGMPCLSAVVSFSPKKEWIEAERKSDRGARQTVSAPFPCTVLFEEVRTPRYPSVEEVTQSLSVPIETWDLAHLGLPFWEIGASGAYLSSADYGVPRPDPVRVVTPDPKLPAFERILSLLSGGIKAREGKLQTLSIDATAASLVRVFAEEGLLPESTS